MAYTRTIWTRRHRRSPARAVCGHHMTDRTRARATGSGHRSGRASSRGRPAAQACLPRAASTSRTASTTTATIGTAGMSSTAAESRKTTASGTRIAPMIKPAQSLIMISCFFIGCGNRRMTFRRAERHRRRWCSLVQVVSRDVRSGFFPRVAIPVRRSAMSNRGSRAYLDWVRHRERRARPSCRSGRIR